MDKHYLFLIGTSSNHPKSPGPRAWWSLGRAWTKELSSSGQRVTNALKDRPIWKSKTRPGETKNTNKVSLRAPKTNRNMQPDIYVRLFQHPVVSKPCLWYKEPTTSNILFTSSQHKSPNAISLFSVCCSSPQSIPRAPPPSKPKQRPIFCLLLSLLLLLDPLSKPATSMPGPMLFLHPQPQLTSALSPSNTSSHAAFPHHTDPLYPPVSLLGVTSYFGNKYKQLRTIANIYKFYVKCCLFQHMWNLSWQKLAANASAKRMVSHGIRW